MRTDRFTPLTLAACLRLRLLSSGAQESLTHPHLNWWLTFDPLGPPARSFAHRAIAVSHNHILYFMAIQFSKNRVFPVTQKDTGAHPLCFRVGTGRLRSVDPRRSAPLSRITEIRLELRHPDSVGPLILAGVACRFNPQLSVFFRRTACFRPSVTPRGLPVPPWGAQK